MLIKAMTIKMPTMEVSSLIPFTFSIITIPIKAMARIRTKTRKTVVNIYPKGCFFISSMAVKITPDGAFVARTAKTFVFVYFIVVIMDCLS